MQNNTKTKTKLIPKLRFKEFEDFWGRKKLGDLVKIKSGISPSKYNLIEEGLYPFLKVEELNNCIKYQSESRFYSNDNHNLIKKNCIIFPKRGAAILNNKVRILSSDSLMDSNLMSINPNKEKLYYEFLYYKIHKEKLYKIADTSTIPQINNKHIEPYKINLPNLPEQQKIANFLTSVDTKIQQLTTKKQLLGTYKKGVMQQLFSQQLRFKPDVIARTKDEAIPQNETEFPDWEEKKLGGIGNFKNGLNKDKKDFGFGSPFVNLMDVFGKHEIINQKFDLVNSNEKDKKLYNLLKGDVLFIRSSVKRTGVGETVIVQENLINTVYSGFLIRFRENQVLLNNGFKKYCFTSTIFRKKLLSFATSSANTNINQESLCKLKLNIPSLKEQQKIAKYLSAIDAKITSVENQITKTQTFKKGLLQQLFI